MVKVVDAESIGVRIVEDSSVNHTLIDHDLLRNDNSKIDKCEKIVEKTKILIISVMMIAFISTVVISKISDNQFSILGAVQSSVFFSSPFINFLAIALIYKFYISKKINNKNALR